MNNLKEKVIAVLSEIYDPEIPVNIWELGLIYDVKVQNDHDVVITMTLTSPNCPVAENLPADVKEKVSAIDGVGEVTVSITFDPPWDMDRMSDAAKLELGFM